MIKKFFIASMFFFFLKCASNRCTQAESYYQFKKVFNNEQESLEKPGEIRFKKKLLPKICSIVHDYKKILFLEEIYMFNSMRNGLIYIFDDKRLYYFTSKSDGTVQL